MKFDLLNYSNRKTIKGEKKGYKTFVMYLAPNRLNDKGINLCPMATKGCIKSCLNRSGNGLMFPKVQLARIRRSNEFINDRPYFLNKLFYEIKSAILLSEFEDLEPVFRLNGTSDIQWENIKIFDNKNIFELFPNVTFYDYTKIVNRFNKKLPSNYHLTFSYSGESDYYKGDIDNLSIKLLNSGINVSVVFRKNLPETFLGYPVVNGDIDDLRFTNKTGVIIGLTAKGVGKTDDSGFVIDI
jgi:hypothetical protein